MQSKDFKNEDVWLMLGDCLERMKEIPDKSVDLILTDPPYGITKNKWDSTIPLDLMWEQINRTIKDNGAVVMTASQPFTTTLVGSNLKNFRYALVWEKQKGSDPLNANRKPLKAHEDIVVFYKKQPVYNPQFTYEEPYGPRKDKSVKSSNFNKAKEIGGDGSSDGKRYPKSVIKISSEGMNSKNLHPTQKPIALMEYLIKTYTNEGETVLDFTMGSGTTGVACKSLNRGFIGIEMDEGYFHLAKGRVVGEVCTNE